MIKAKAHPLSTAYDEAYSKAQEVFDRHNPCQIRREADGSVSCAESRSPRYDGWNYSGLCCTGCRYLGPTGCTTNSLACKLWSCFTIRDNNPEVVHELRLIRADSYEKGLPVSAIRFSKDEVLR